jgi:hypothetical protein
MSEQVQRQTHYLIGCENCGHYEEPPRPEPCSIAAPPADPMRCEKCGQTLTLLECFIAPDSVMWQEKIGATHQHVAFADQLPTTGGRSLWMPR